MKRQQAVCGERDGVMGVMKAIAQRHQRGGRKASAGGEMAGEGGANERRESVKLKKRLWRNINMWAAESEQRYQASARHPISGLAAWRK